MKAMCDGSIEINAVLYSVLIEKSQKLEIIENYLKSDKYLTKEDLRVLLGIEEEG